MDEESPYCPVEEPADEHVGESTERTSDEVESAAQIQHLEESPIFNYVDEIKDETKGEPPFDWFEPLEDDDDDDVEEGSLGGESEISLSVGTTEKKPKKAPHFYQPRGRKSHPDEGWEEWPQLGDGWKRKEVIRRSGSSIGQKDVYYLSPRGERVRSRVELVSVLDGILDLSQFEYKTGLFLNGQVPKRRRKKKIVRERSSSESSWMERGEGADTPDSIHRLTPNLNIQQNQTFFLLPRKTEPTVKSESPNCDSIKLPLPSASRHNPLPAINGEVGSQESILECSRCGVSFTGTKYDKKRKRPCCASCWASKTKEHPMIRFRKWIPCGQCMGCLTTLNCGQCANCKNGFQGTELRKRICRKRRCSCPIRKGLSGSPFVKKTEVEEIYEDVSNQFHPTPSLKSSDTENVSLNLDLDMDQDDDDDLSTDDDDDWHKKRKRRSCGECKACLCRRDCGTCDFCVDKPKFGGSNKKRQKCRLRQCQRQAMRHLLPAEMEIEYGADNLLLPGRPRPHYTYSRKMTTKKNKPNAELDMSDNDDDDIHFSQSWRLESESNDLKFQSSMQVNHSEIVQLNGVEEIFAHASNNKSSNNDQPRKINEGKAFKYKDGPKLVFNREEDPDEDEDEDDFPMHKERGNTFREDLTMKDEKEIVKLKDSRSLIRSFPRGVKLKEVFFCQQITHIFSLANRSNSVGGENQLVKLLKSLQETELPLLWYAIMVDGPQLQLIQCSKQSSMADTMVLIGPACHFQITVQKQPLLPTHWLYDDFPARLDHVAEVVDLLKALEKYMVCHGLPPKDSHSSLQPISLARASTCHFLVKKNVGVCSNCKLLCE